MCTFQVVRGRRSERLNGSRVSADRAVDGRRVRSPLVAERHVLLKADKVTTWKNFFVLLLYCKQTVCGLALKEFCLVYVNMP